MLKTIFSAIVLSSLVSFAYGTKSEKTPAAADKKAEASAAKVDVTGGLKWTGYGLGKSHAGDLKLAKGQVEMKGEELVGGVFEIDMKSLTTPDSDRLQSHLKSADFFDIEKYPNGSFKITKVEAIKGAKAGEATHKITGDLTIKGKTHPETFSAVIQKDGTKWTAKATLEIADRTKYDIVYNSAKFKKASELGDKLIKDNITITLDVATK